MGSKPLHSRGKSGALPPRHSDSWARNAALGLGRELDHYGKLHQPKRLYEEGLGFRVLGALNPKPLSLRGFRASRALGFSIRRV